MHVKYFTDTDTAYIQMTHKTVAETQEINPNVYIDLDEDGNLVGMTIEHAQEKTDMNGVSFEEVVAA